MRRLFIALPLMLILQIAPRAQQAPASVEGIVTRAGTGEPLPGARVTLTRVTASTATAATSPVLSATIGALPPDASVVAVSGSALSSISPVTTGADGKFAFQNLDAGLYSLQVLRDGYARQSYGQRLPGGPATALRLAEGRTISNVAMALVQAGNLSGVIRGTDGQPQAGVPIQLLRATYNASGQRAFEVEGSARTNDRGEYRLYWLTPGRYYLSAGTPPGPSRTNANPAGNPNEIPDRSFAFTYYPGVWDARAAGIIDVNSGAELNGIDFVVQRQQLHRIRGRIVDSSTGQAPVAVGLSLAYRTLTGNSGAFSAGEKYNAKTGEFELRNVPAGSYVVQALALDQNPSADGEALVRVAALATRANARVPIEVSNADVDGVLLSLTMGVAVPGRITVDGRPLSSITGWDRIRVQLKPTLDSSFGPSMQPAAPIPQPPRADGAFTIAGLSPGEFVVGPITGLPAGFYIKEARFGQSDVLSQPLRFSGAQGAGLEIVLSSKASQLDGTALDLRSGPAAGARLVLVPDLRNRTDLYKTALSDSTGRFVFRSIPPGDYRLFGWEALESYAYFDQDLLRRAEPQSVPVRITDSVANTVNVRLIPANQ